MIPMLDLDFKFDLYFVLDLKFHHDYDFKLTFPALAMGNKKMKRKLILNSFELIRTHLSSLIIHDQKKLARASATPACQVVISSTFASK